MLKFGSEGGLGSLAWVTPGLSKSWYICLFCWNMHGRHGRGF